MHLLDHRLLDHRLFDSRLFDSRRLDQRARELAAVADLVRRRRSQLRLAAQQLPWHSPASQSWELGLTGLCDEFGTLARQLESLADSVAAHGRHAARRAEHLRAAAGAVAAGLSSSAGRVARAATELARDVATPPAVRP